jgi:hypothetical protein
MFAFIGFQAAEMRRPTDGKASSSGSASESKTARGMSTTASRTDDASVTVIQGMAAVREALELNRSRTYLANVLEQNDSSVRRWPTSTARPIRVWIADPTQVKGGLTGGQRYVRQAFDEWVMVGIPVRFEFVADSAAADVQVLWTESLTQKRVGVTSMAGVDDFFTKGIITVATHRPTGEILAPVHVASTVLHEVGHMLGLGHASDTVSVMFPQMSNDLRTRRVVEIDRATLELLYRLPVGRVR